MDEFERRALDAGHDEHAGRGENAPEIMPLSRVEIGAEPHRRKHLLTRLLENRGVVRYISAPKGFGKSTLAYEYADMAFGRDETLWVDCQDPSFLCNLDSGRFPGCYFKDGTPALVTRLLVVFDDLCMLDEERAAVFSDGIDQLLSAGIEVIVNSIPANDCLGQMQQDRIYIAARDLLVEQGEISEDHPVSSEMMAASLGIPSLIWLSGDATEIACVRGFFSEGLPMEVKLPALAMFLLVEGTLGEVEDIGISVPQDVCELLARSYPQVGLRIPGDRFHTVEVPVDELLECARGVIDAERSREIVDSIVGLLSRKREVSRAIDLIRMVGGEHAVLDWVEEYGYELIDRGFVYEVRTVLSAARSYVIKQRQSLIPLYAWAEYVDGDIHGAVNLCTCRYSSAPPVDEPARKALSYLVSRIFTAESSMWRASTQAKAAGELDASIGCALQCMGNGGLSDCPAVREGTEARRCMCAMLLACAALGFAEACGDEVLPAGCIDEVPDDVIGQDAVFRHVLEADWRTAVESWPASTAPCFRRLLLHMAFRLTMLVGEEYPSDELVSSMMDALVSCMEWERTSLTAAMLFNDLVELFQADACTSTQLIPSISVEPELSSTMSEQIQRIESLFTPISEKDQEAVEPETVTPVNQKRTDVFVGGVRVPFMYLRLFGGFEVYLDGELSLWEMWGARRVRILFCLLAVAKSNEILNKTAAESIWPDCDAKHRRSNFYSMFSYMRRQAGMEEFPYIIRSQETCRFNCNCLRTDLADFDEVIRGAISERGDRASRIKQFARIDEIYRGDLFPSEGDLPTFDHMRSWYQGIYVDTMINASARAIEDGDALAGLWFARKAYERGTGREDVYRALMSSQIAAGQRAAAIETFDECRRYLKDEFGVLPSDETVDLYNRALLSRYRRTRGK